MQWLDRSKDLLALTIATVAVVLSLIAAVIQKRQQQRDAFRHIQDVLMSEDIQGGRWMIGEISRGKRDFPDQFSPEYYRINRALGVWDTLAMYVRRGMVPRSWVLDMWHHALAEMRPTARELARRLQESELSYRPWPELWSLLEDAARYRSSLSCCSSSRDVAGKTEPAP
jgi:hypothetical protein